MTEFLLTLSNALLLPVVGLLLLLLVLTSLHLGGFAREIWERARRRPAFRELVAALRTEPERTLARADLPVPFGLAELALREPAPHEDKLFDDLQLRSERALARLLLIVRLGPVLGLAGTLIPLGPGLVALSSGDLATLSDKLVVAFTTTVLGLVASGSCFAMHTLRRQWYMQDLSDLEFLLGRLR